MTDTIPIPVPGTYNFRDVGGYPADFGAVRPGKLYRSDGLHALGEDGRKKLADLDIGIVIDLRDDFEATAMPDDIAGLELDVRRLPIFEGSGGSQSVVGVGLTDLYSIIVDLHADVVAAAIRDIALSGSTPVLVHCTAGKDRTGVVVALALLAVGVDRAVVVSDYSQSQSNLGGPWLEGMLQVIAAHGIPETPELRVLMGGSPPEALDLTIDHIESEHGSVRAYLLSAGITYEELALLQSALVYSPE